MHAAKASTKRAALFELEAAPVPDTQIFGYTVTIVTYYLSKRGAEAALSV